MAQVTGRNARAAAAGPELPERYTVVSMIGAGGMASIWAADDEVLRRRVAIKVLADQYAEQPRFVARFEREARTAALLSGHPHVVTIYDVGDVGGRPFIVMEHLAGGSLAQRMATVRPRREDVLRWLREAASALDFAHEKGVVHRDVKPRNLLFDDRDRLVVADFGIARAAFEDSLTVSGELLGTAAYISPEQTVGEPASAASDRYSLAVVAFEALTGGLPFGGGTLVEIAQRRTEQPPPRASDRLQELPRAVDDVLLRGLGREPAARWPSAGAFVEALADALGDAPGPAPSDTAAATVAAAAPAPVSVPARSEASPAPAPAARATPDELASSPPVAWSHPRRRFRVAPVLLGLAAVAVGLIVGLGVLNGDGGGGDGAAGERSARERPAAKSKAPQSSEREPAAPAPAPSEPSGEGGDASPAELNDRGFALMNAGRYDEAIPVLQKAVSSFPEGSSDLTLAYALYNLGRSLRLAGRPDEAIPVLERRLGFNNQRGVVKKELAAARREAGGGEGRGRGGGGGGGGDEEGD